MKLFMCCLLFLFATMVLAAPIRVQTENVLSFLNDALGTTTEKTTPAAITANKNPPSKPEPEQDSEDMSEAKSKESPDTYGRTDVFIDPDSHETVIPKVVDKDQAPSRRKTGDNMRLVDVSSRLVQDQGSREHSEPHVAQQASRERTDLNSEEGMIVDTHGAKNMPGKQVIHSSGDQVTGNARLGTSLQRKATPRRVNGLNGMLPPGQSREPLDLDSLEVNNGRPAPVGNRGEVDYDETREFMSSEMYPVGAVAAPGPSSLSVPAKS